MLKEGLTFEFQFVAKGPELQCTFESIVSRGKMVKKEELHFKAKVKDMKPNHEEMKTKSMEKEKSKHKEDKGEKHKVKDKEKHKDSELGEMKNK
ncbi:hypothetical protein PVK06_010804 [Gossypium arboreum]|uniref:Uncharacterized protein n=1 Tax=Gossypium arboreum TaxID=29729 RepID=A0ABR0Q896_GOSAR|nr:hypothetical protein PVK06_010804 [Gossypium arboreum]